MSVEWIYYISINIYFYYITELCKTWWLF